jgi:hypothetical protein
MNSRRSVLFAGFTEANLADILPVIAQLQRIDWRIVFVAGYDLEEHQTAHTIRAILGPEDIYYDSAKAVSGAVSAEPESTTLLQGRSPFTRFRRATYTKSWLAEVSPEILGTVAAANEICSSVRIDITVLPEDSDVARGRPWSMQMRRLGVPVIVHWPAWYNLLAEYASLGPHYADRWLVYSTHAREKLLNNGVSFDRIRVVGSPRFQQLPVVHMADTVTGSEVLFFAQHREDTPYYAYELAKAAAALGLRLTIKLHPADTMQIDRLRLLAELSGSVRVVKHLPSEELLNQARCIVTISSSALFEALLAGRPVVSLRYAINLDELGLDNGNDWVRVARTRDSLIQSLREICIEEPAFNDEERHNFRNRHLGVNDGQAVNRIVDEMKELAG